MTDSVKRAALAEIRDFFMRDRLAETSANEAFWLPSADAFRGPADYASWISKPKASARSTMRW